jgi:predicted YcjX-like family ATPase
MIGKSRYTLDPETIRRWVEERGGRPAVVKVRSRSDYDAAAPRIDFPQYRSTGVLQRISWEQFFRKFDEKRLAFVYQERTRSGQLSRYFKFISRDLAGKLLPRELAGLRRV